VYKCLEKPIHLREFFRGRWEGAKIPKKNSTAEKRMKIGKKLEI